MGDLPVEASREDMIDLYMEAIHEYWEMSIDHEDGSTAPFTSLALEELCSQL